ncbi:hypothetical protein JYU34_016996 [Plutella xylostella]|uniref:Protein amnionless n=1 Tax=Plutella xylostella TaxID=51655 RepID=A0ABQ7Q4A1_PLUXY|nr:hypothetical protein JYU34_016996 [Plutella xylostella]
MYKIFFLHVLFFTSLSSSAVLKWIPSASFDLAINFNDKKLPCSKQTVVFPESIMETIRIRSKTHVKGLVLPVNSEISLETDAIEFGGGDKEDGCEEGNAYYLDRSASSWAQADVWQSDRFNEATPDAERIPCYDDLVEFPEESQFTVKMPDVSQVTRGIKVNGEVLYSTVQFIRHAFSFEEHEQSFVPNENLRLGVSINMKAECTSPAGCPCQKFPVKIDCSTKFCPKPTCLEPIKPIGHCCKICGGALAFEVDQSFIYQRFKELVQETVMSYGEERLVYHVGRIVSDTKELVQVVVLDKDGYTGTSAEVVNDLQYVAKTHSSQLWVAAMMSGSPLSKAGLGAKIAVSMFFVVAMFMGAIYAYYYKLPSIQLPSLGRDRHTAISRFQRRTDSVVTLTRRDSTVSLPSATAFRNPLYDSKRGRGDTDND